MRPSFCTAAKCYSIKSAPTRTGILELQNERGSFDGFIIGGEAGLGDRWRSKKRFNHAHHTKQPPTEHT